VRLTTLSPGPYLDVTHPSRWEKVRRIGKLAFLVRYGIIAVGVPSALLLNAGLAWAHGDVDLLLSVRNAIELTFTLLLVGPIVGALAGQALWSRGERRSGRLDADAFADAPAARQRSGRADPEQIRLSALKDRLDVLARTAPKRLVWRAIGMTALGYAYVVFVLAVLVGGLARLATTEGSFAPLARQGAWMLGWFSLFVISALWVRVLEPQGRRITRAGSPALFAALDEIQRTLNAPAPDVVLIDGQFNASVTEIPRYGIVGLPRRYLVIGLPLLEGLTTDECRAILAHELAHLSRRHGRRLVWVARLSVTWQNLAASLEAGRHWGRALFLPFFRWYAPRFALYAHAVARRDEHESDALAAECVGAAVTARALLRLHVQQQFLAESFLPTIYRLSADRAEPPDGMLERMAVALRAERGRRDDVRWTRRILGERTLDAHTHPCLADRVGRLGLDLGTGELAVEAGVDLLHASRATRGADPLLGAGRVTKLRAQVGRDWQAETLDNWRRWNADALIWRTASDRPAEEQSMEVLWARARWATDCETAAVALPLVREVLRRDPTHLEATVYLGRLLADSDDTRQRAEGMRHLEDALHRDTALALLTCAALEAQYARLGWRAEVERVQTRGRELRGALLKGLRERRELRVTDRLVPYALPAPALDTLQRACAAQNDVTSAYLVRKRTRYLREQPCVMLAVECDVPWYKPSTGADAVEACKALLTRVALPEAADLLVLPVEPRSALRRRLRSIVGAELYRRS
jgi:Zn-dependent protease with chaperone function